MQAATSRFLARADAQMRPLTWSLAVSFARDLDEDATFFTVGVSAVGGPDPIKGTEDVLQQWDKYYYFDYTGRVVSMEWSQSMDPLYSVQSAMGDIVLNNWDDYLSGDNFALPYRPLRLGMGFGNELTGGPEVLPQFVGVTEKAPTLDRSSKTASYHALDFMGTIYNRQISQDTILQNVSTDQALDALLQLVGLSPTQYDLDPGMNVIPFVYFPADTKFGDAAQQLMQAEMGRLFMTETGRITFHNRQHYSDTPVWYFDGSNVIDVATSTQDDIINVVEITANVREVQDNQPIYESTTAVEVPAGATVDLPFANFSDPVITVDTPVPYISSTTSYYQANSQADGLGTDITSGLTLTVEQFSTSYLMTFENTTGSSIFLTNVQLYGTPAPVVRTVYIREQDAASVLQYDEQVLSIQNDFFVDEATARSRAKMILADHASFGTLQTVTVKGNPALQVNDAATFSLRQRTYVVSVGDTLFDIATAYGMTLEELEELNPQLGPDFDSIFPGDLVYLGVVPELCTIIGIQNKLDGPIFTQELKVKPLVRQIYFTVGVSAVGSDAVVAP